MTKKLKMHFIGLATTAVLIVIIVVIGMINIRTYMTTRSEVYDVLDYIIDADADLQPVSENKKFNFSAELPYSCRYFYVTLDAKNKVEEINLSHIATVTKGTASEYAQKILPSKHNRDIFIQNGNFYAYEKLPGLDGKTTIVFLDCTSYFQSELVFLRLSIIYGLLCLALFVVIIAMFADRAVAPIIKNIDKQKTFITNAGHELKTPLAIISANTELMEMLYGKNEWTESTLKQVNRLTALIKNLITISRMNEQSDLTLTEINLSKVVNDIVPSFKTLALQQAKEIKTDIPADLTVQGIETSLQEVTNILLDNAVKYCDDEGIIDITLAAKGKNVRLMVSNTFVQGEKIDYTRFMDRFYRQDPSRNEKKGFGIGLSMAEALCEQMKGKLQVSYRGGMISFTATLQKS